MCKNRSLEKYHIAVIITPVILFSLVYNLPRFFELEVYQNDYHNSTQIVPTAMRMHHLYVHIYIVWINLFVMGIIPYATLITLNIWIFQRLWNMRLGRNENGVRLSLSQVVPPNLVWSWGTQDVSVAWLGSLHMTEL